MSMHRFWKITSQTNNEIKVSSEVESENDININNKNEDESFQTGMNCLFQYN